MCKEKYRGYSAKRFIFKSKLTGNKKWTTQHVALLTFQFMGAFQGDLDLS
jgi:hypothetical protein